ncbi:hypothetical protein [Runella sp.]|uniref:hypothetical protein n=1 Tax=Runella sp. TaxID=1960881 RepID=UPI003D0CA247
MNAHKELVKPQNGMLMIPVPEDMKEGSLFEVFIAVAKHKKKTRQETSSSKHDLSKLAGILKDISQEEKDKMDKFFTGIRNEWVRDI